MANSKIIKIGGASGYWGESDMAVPQFLADSRLDYIVFDYLAEITMSIMARARAKDASKGYALDFVSSVLKPNLLEIANQGVKIISNAGGVNPVACGAAIRELLKELGLDLRVAVITGDDILASIRAGDRGSLREMYAGTALPAAEKTMSANAYLGAFPIAEALNKGADIVVTGRCVDSAVTLGACIHEFGWAAEDLDALAGGSLAGHVIECGPQATGGNFTDWREVSDNLANIGYPIVEITPAGTFICTKPKNSGGMVTIGTISEQIVYEIGDPQAYILPDVICDFAGIKLEKIAKNRIRVSGARGSAAPDSYKASITYMDGYRGVMSLSFTGFEADEKVKVFSDAVLVRAREKLGLMNAPDYTEISLEVLGTECQYGSAAQTPKRAEGGAREIIGKFAFKHSDQKAIILLFKEITGMALASPAGLSGLGGGRPKPSPVVRLFSCTIPKNSLTVSVEIDGETSEIQIAKGQIFNPEIIERPALPSGLSAGEMTTVPLIKLAWGRSGDKGNKANIGIVARKPEYLPYIVSALTEQVVAERFAHFLDGPLDELANPVERFLMPGLSAINFLLHDVLGGGGMASLRNDPQGKCYAQILLDHPIAVPIQIVESLS
ncbi:MAG: DUF1446 domain-containing protein [Xanthomonadales bacterium]|nr:DUF1446 domain-containing protein [Xanthomonadales bacterium]